MNQTETEPTTAPPAAVTPHGAELGAPTTQSAPPSRTVLFFLLGSVGLVLAILAVITVVSRSRARAQLETDTIENLVPTVSIIHPKRTAAQVELDLPGNITAFEEAPIYARVNGYLKHWSTDIGTRVAEGQELATIETPELDQELKQATAALAQANANLEIARISAERWQNLRKSDSVSQQDVARPPGRCAGAGGQRPTPQRNGQLQKARRPLPRHHHHSDRGRRHAHHGGIIPGDFPSGED